MPTSFPRLEKASVIAIDTETFDPELDASGPGWARGRGHMVGLAVAVQDGPSWYFPTRHAMGDNLPEQNVLKWARDELTRKRQPKLFANAGYDIGWLQQHDVHVQGRVIDVQLAEPLLDEYAHSYALEILGIKYLDKGKEDDVLYTWLAAAFGGKADRKGQGKNIHRAPATLVGPYAQRDASMLFGIWDAQKLLLDQQGLTPVFDLECRLVYMLVAMRRRGVRVDLDKARLLEDQLTSRLKVLVDSKLAGINVNSPNDLVAYCHKRGIKYPNTAAGNPSFAGKWVDKYLPDVGEARRLMKARDTFIRGYLYDHHVNGRVHCQFNQMRSDEYGAVGGRFSSSTPNLQNIPVRDEELAPLVRGLYVPDVDKKLWRRFDWSQLQYRLLVHYAVGRGANDARAMYNEDPKTDFHEMASEIIGIPRKPTKTINFGMVFGMGVDAMADNMGRPKDEVEPMLETYHSKFPFVRATFDEQQRVARRDGFITTLSGRRARLPDRQDTRKALNRKLQGGEGDIMKTSMVALWEQGLCDEVGVPHITVHDELDNSDDGSPQFAKVFNEWQHVMESCVKLRVPLLCSMELGPDWGNVK